MSKISKNKWIKVTTTLATFFSSAKTPAIDLQSKIKNADRNDFNTISSPFKRKTGEYSIIGEMSDTRQPLILKQANGKNQTLIEGLQAFELSFLYEMTDKIQLGILVPGEKPYGLIGPFNEAKNYLSNILIEPKVYISNNVALIPVYYVPSKNKNQLTISGQNQDINFGLENGAYGLKVSMGNKNDNGITTAYQIGAIIAPESKFRDIDQTMKIQFGAGVKKELSGGLKLLAEAYGEKYKSNTPLEALAMIEYSNDKFMVRFGGGTGDLQGSGSNTTRMLANFSYYFGEESKSVSAPKEVETPKLSEKPISEDDFQKFKEKVEKTEDLMIDEKLQELEKIEELKKKINESTDQSKSAIPFIELIVMPTSNKDIFQSMMDEESDSNNLDFIKDLNEKEFEALFEQDIKGFDFKTTVKRSLASAANSNLLARLEEVHVTQTAILEIRKRDFHWTEEKAKYVLLNLRRTNLSLKENIDFYKKLSETNQDVTKVVNEMNWGLRVFKRNLNSWNLLISSYMQDTNQSIDRLDLNNSVIHANYSKEAMELLGKKEEAIEQQIEVARKNELSVGQDYQVIVASKLNLRTSPSILWDNVAGQLANGDLVRAKKSELANQFVEIEVVNSSLFNNKLNLSPLYVHSKYLKKVESKPEAVQTPSLTKKETPQVIEDKISILDTFEEATKLNNSGNTQNVVDVLNTFKVIQDAEKELASKKANTIEIVPVEVPQTQELNEKLDQVMKESSKEVIKDEGSKEKLTDSEELALKKASKIEIVYEEEPKKEKKKVKTSKLPEKKVVAQPMKEAVKVEEVKVEEIKTVEPTLKAEDVKVVEAPSVITPSVEVKSTGESVKEEIKVEASEKASKIEVVPEPTPLVAEKIEAIVKETPKEKALQNEMSALEKIIEMKSKEKASEVIPVIEVKAVPEVKKEEPKVSVEPSKMDPIKAQPVKSVDIMDKAIEQKTIELENQKKSGEVKEKDPSKVEPLKLQEDYPMEEVQKGPKF
jgi:hypothetical protein